MHHLTYLFPPHTPHEYINVRHSFRDAYNLSIARHDPLYIYYKPHEVFSFGIARHETT